MNTIGNFVREVEIEGSKFFLRGLTVAEYMDLVSIQDANSSFISESIYMEIAMCSILGWEDVWVGGEELEVSEENKEEIDYITLIEIGKYAYEKLTYIDEATVLKYRGYVRFMHYLSDEKYQSAAKFYDCSKCVANNLHLQKKCGKTPAQIAALKGSGQQEEAPQKSKIDKMRHRRRGRAKKKPVSNSLKLMDFDFPECPVSWIDSYVKDWGEIFYRCAKDQQLLFDGNVGSQIYMLYKLQNIVSAEANMIEYEKMKKQQKEASKK